jgi:transcriptional/translational regulatory protein YebC/TACO1
MYDHLCVVAFIGLDEEATLEALIEAEIDVEDIEMNGDTTVIYGNPNDLFDIKNAIIAKLGEIKFETDEIVMIPKDTIKLEGEDMEVFAKSLKMLDEIEDVQKVYHNVENA